MTNKTEKPKVKPFVNDNGDLEYITKLGRKFVVKDLNGLEQTRADKYAGDFIAMAQYRAAFAVKSIDGKPMMPIKNNIDMDSALQSIKGKELDELMMNIQKYLNPDEEELKNESTPEG